MKLGKLEDCDGIRSYFSNRDFQYHYYYYEGENRVIFDYILRTYQEKMHSLCIKNCSVLRKSNFDLLNQLNNLSWLFVCTMQHNDIQIPLRLIEFFEHNQKLQCFTLNFYPKLSLEYERRKETLSRISLRS